MIIIGITGTLGAGKGTVVDYLVREKGFVHFSVRGFLTEIIHSQQLPLNRDTLTQLANDLRQAYGPSYIIEQLYRKAVETNENCIIESIRTPGEIEALRQKPRFFLVSVDADLHTRFHRIKHRNSETDQIDLATFMQNEAREMHSEDPNKQNLSACIRQADYGIVNNGSVKELNHNIESILQKIQTNTQH